MPPVKRHRRSSISNSVIVPDMKVSAMLAAVAMVLGFGWFGGQSWACACGEFRGVVVAHGTSPYGVPWRIKARLAPATKTHPRAFEAYFSIGEKGSYAGAGHFTGLYLPLHPAFTFTALTGSEAEGAPEGDVNGLVRRSIAKLVIKMSDGELIEAQPMFAPRAKRKRHKWLRGMGAYQVFYAAHQEVRAIAAYDLSGRVVDVRRRDRRGIFR